MSALRRLRSLRPRMLLDAHYWRKAWRELRGRWTEERHVEALLPEAVEVHRGPGQGSLAGAGRLLYVAPRYDYGDPARGLSYEENAFFDTFAHGMREVIRFDPLETVRRHGRAAANELLLEVAWRRKPDVAFFVLFQDEIAPGTLDELRAPGGPATLNWFTDDHWRFDDFSRHWAPHFDRVVTTDAGAVAKYEAIGARPILSQWGFNPRLYRPWPGPKEHDVVFVGQPYGERRRTVQRLRAAGIDVRTWGWGWPEGRLTQRRMVRALGSARVALNLSGASRGRFEQIKGRTFEIPGCGSLLLTERAPRLEEYFVPGEEIVTFGDFDELLEATRRYLADAEARERIAASGRRRAVADHTWYHRFKAIFRDMDLL